MAISFDAACQSPIPVWADTARAEALLTRSGQLFGNDNFEEALEKAKQALDIYTRLCGENHVKTARARLFVAREYRAFHRESEAIALIEQSLHTFESEHNTYLTALCYNQLSLCYLGQYRFEEAGKSVRRAIALLRPDSSAQVSTMAKFYVTLGTLYNAEKKFQQAIPVLEAAKSVFVSFREPRSVGETSYHIGNAYYGLQDYERAKEHYLTAFASLETVLGAEHSYFADLYVKFGTCCQKTGDSKTGLRYMLEARDGYLKAGTDNLNYIQFLQYLGQFYLAEQQYPAALEQLQLCLSAKEKYHGIRSPRLTSILQDLGEACLNTGQFDQAEACYRRGLQIIMDSLLEDPKIAFPVYSKLAALRLAQRDYPGCLLLCDTAAAIAGFDVKHPEKMLPRDYFRELCQLYGKAHYEQFRQTADTATLALAEHFFALAGETLYREVEEITVKSSRELIYDRDHQVLEQWLEARMQLYAVTGKPEHAEAAFRIAGQSKAFLLAEAMRRNGSLHFAGVPDSILQAELSLRERIVAAEKILDTCCVQSGAEKHQTALQLNRELAAWRMEYDALLRRIEVAYPEYYRLRLLRREVSPAELRRTGLAPEQALLLYSLTDSNGYVFVLTRDTFCALRLPLDAGFDEQLENFRKSLTVYFTTPDPDDALYDRSSETYITLAQALYRQLILPVAALLPQRVVVVPEGKLCYLPFEALLTGAPPDPANFKTYPFLTLQKAVSYGLSTDFLVETAAPSTQKAEKNWLGVAPFADPEATGQIVARGALRDQFGPLPGSGREVAEIAALVKGETWLGAAARPGRFRKEAFRYRILHLATHSRADDRQGDYSYLAIGRTGEPMPAKDLYQFRLAAEMVVLSSCEAGGGQLLRGEGIIGLVRALTFAGARSIVASQWVANDQSTANLMIDFYRNLRTGMPKDLALQSARVHLLNQAPTEGHPFFWAGFRVFGNVAPLWP